VWEYKRTPRFVDNHIGGLTSTAGGLVFGGDQSTFFALDAASGAELWSVRTGGSIVAAPVTYSVDGEQQVAIAAGGDLFAFALPRRPSAQPTVVADR
jgi:glucose dehydrogenase